MRTILLLLLLSVNLWAQNDRPTQASNITSNVYTNGHNAITGATLQSVMLNQNNSYVNLISDTNLLDIRKFSTLATYTAGMGVFYGDTIFMNKVGVHGAWVRADWIPIATALPDYYVSIGSGPDSLYYPYVAMAAAVPHTLKNSHIADGVLYGNGGIHMTTATLIDSTNSLIWYPVPHTNAYSMEIFAVNDSSYIYKETGKKAYLNFILQPTADLSGLNEWNNVITNSKLIAYSHTDTLPNCGGSFMTDSTPLAGSNVTIKDTIVKGVHRVKFYASGGGGGSDTGTNKAALSVYQAGITYIAKADTISGASYLTGSSQVATNYSAWDYKGNSNHDTLGVVGNGYSEYWRFQIGSKTNTNTPCGFVTNVDANGENSTAFGVHCLDSVKNIAAQAVTGFGSWVARYYTGTLSCFFGTGAGHFMRKGYNNVAFGTDAMNDAPFGGGTYPIGRYLGANNCTAIGFDALANGDNTSYNTAVGASAMASTTYTSCIGNTTIGAKALSGLYTGANNVGIGYQVASIMDAGSWNVFIGTGAILDTSGSQNIAIGDGALWDNKNGSNHIAIGESALFSTLNTSNEIGIGFQSFFTNVSGTKNTGVGYETGASNTGNSNSAFGWDAFLAGTGNYNCAFGVQSLAGSGAFAGCSAFGWYSLSVNTGSENSAFGQNSLYLNTSGINNSAFAYEALYHNTTGMNNTGMGIAAGFTNTTASSNSSYGSYAGYLTTGSWNTFFGDSAGYTNTSGTFNTALGYKALVGATLTNATSIGNGAVAAYSNSFNKGNASVTIEAGYGELMGYTTSPTIALGTGAGTGATYSDTATNYGLILVVNTAGSPSTLAIVATITYTTAYATGSNPIVSYGNAGSALSGGFPLLYTSGSKTQCNINVGTTALATSTTYVFRIHYYGW